MQLRPYHVLVCGLCIVLGGLVTNDADITLVCAPAELRSLSLRPLRAVVYIEHSCGGTRSAVCGISEFSKLLECVARLGH